MKLSARDRPAPPRKGLRRPLAQALAPTSRLLLSLQTQLGCRAWRLPGKTRSTQLRISHICCLCKPARPLSAENADGEDGRGGRLWERAGRSLRAQPQVMTSVWDPGEASHRAGGPRAGQQQTSQPPKWASKGIWKEALASRKMLMKWTSVQQVMDFRFLNLR